MGMKVVNGLRYEDTIFYEEDGNKYKMIVYIRMDDECKKHICEFAITSSIYELYRSRWIWYKGGCCHDEILKHAPQYKCFVDLHLCNHYRYGGMNGVLNAIYWFKHNKIEFVKSSLRLKGDEYSELQWFMNEEESLKWKLSQMGIIDRWHKEALEAIEYLNELTGCRWHNPYSKEEERFVMKPLTDEENSLIEERFASGYYSKERVEKRREEALKKKIDEQKDEQKAKALEEYNKATSRCQEILNIKFSILNEGILLDNVIVYEHSKEVTFNWKGYEVQVTREDFDRYVAKMKELCLFEDWTFNFGENKR